LFKGFKENNEAEEMFNAIVDLAERFENRVHLQNVQITI
jgi:hypothetical protein